MRNYLLLILIIVCSCESKKAENANGTRNYTNEEFQFFIKRFKEDTTFQKNRIKFPIVTKYINGKNEIIYKTNTIDDWEILNYYVPDRLKDNYSHEYLPKAMNIYLKVIQWSM